MCLQSCLITESCCLSHLCCVYLHSLNHGGCVYNHALVQNHAVFHTCVVFINLLSLNHGGCVLQSRLYECVYSYALIQNHAVSHTCAVFIYILLIMVSVFTVMPWYTSLPPLCACDCLLFCTDANPELLGISSVHSSQNKSDSFAFVDW